MGTFKAYFRKEMIESWRQYRYLVLGIGFILFAVLNPVMLKLLPALLKTQVPEEMVAYFQMQSSPAKSVVDYLQDVFQMVPLFVILGLMGTLADEIREQRLVFPYSKGAEAGNMVLAKFCHYTGFVVLSIFAGFAINLFYSNMLFVGEKVTLGQMMGAGALFAIFYAYAIALLFLMSSLQKRGIAAALTVLFTIYFSAILAGIKGLAGWIPNTLINQANQLYDLDSGLIVHAGLVTISLTVVFLWGTIWRMKRVEVI